MLTALNLDPVNEAACPACGRVNCYHCPTDVGHLLASIEACALATQESLEKMRPLIMYAENRGRYRDDVQAQTLASKCSKAYRDIDGRFAGLRRYAKVLAMGLVAVVFALGWWSSHSQLQEIASRQAGQVNVGAGCQAISE